MTQLAAGEVIVRKAGQDSYLAVSDGFVEITGDHVAILADMAIRAENIEEVKAEEARRRAEARLAEHLGSEEVATVEATITYSVAQLKVKRRHPRK
jgi:F-type H+-transporting ATPase subunit epsilon